MALQALRVLQNNCKGVLQGSRVAPKMPYIEAIHALRVCTIGSAMQYHMRDYVQALRVLFIGLRVVVWGPRVVSSAT